MEIDFNKLSLILKDLMDGTIGACCESAVFIGEIDGKPIRISVMSKNEAEETYDYEETLDKYNCIISSKSSDSHAVTVGLVCMHCGDVKEN